MVRVVIFIEGGSGDKSKGSRELNSEARRAFGKLFESAGLRGAMPEPRVCGSRDAAFKDFKIASQRRTPQPTHHLLLVDSEGPVTGTPWEHVLQRDHWERPDGVSDDDLHFMVECMEAWLVADPEALAGFYGKDFDRGALPKRQNFEEIPKLDLYKALYNAVRHTKPAGAKGSGLKGQYSKGAHSFKCLATVDPKHLNQHWARRFFDRLRCLAGR